MIVRSLAAGAIALLLAVQVVRIALVRQFDGTDPVRAARIMPGQPVAEIGQGMIAIAANTRTGQPIDQATLDRIYGASIAAPLAEEPFLVRGVQAQLAGDESTAERAFSAARLREGRSLPARYFLADHYLRRNDARRGLAEIAVLARLVPGGIEKLAPYVAAFAAQRAAWPELRRVFAREPLLEGSSLKVMAADARNADAVLALATPGRRNADSPWLPTLVASLSDAGRHRDARRIWAEVAGVGAGAGALLYYPEFREPTAPPPFNWVLTSSRLGLAERQPGRGLRVIYYGQEDGVLASQLLVLPPGRYRLSVEAAGLPSGAENLRWVIYCGRSETPVASAPLDRAVREGLRFAITAGCPGQRLELVGTAGELARQTDLAIRRLSLTREQAGA